MRRDVAPEDQVEQLTLTETIDVEPSEATDEELFAYVSGRVGQVGQVVPPARRSTGEPVAAPVEPVAVPAEPVVAPAEPAWLVEAFALPPLEAVDVDDGAFVGAVAEPAWVEDAFWSIRIGGDAIAR